VSKKSKETTTTPLYFVYVSEYFSGPSYLLRVACPSQAPAAVLTTTARISRGVLKTGLLVGQGTSTLMPEIVARTTRQVDLGDNVQVHLMPEIQTDLGTLECRCQ